MDQLRLRFLQGLLSPFALRDVFSDRNKKSSAARGRWGETDVNVSPQQIVILAP
jgi:hypothetical protein